MRIVQGAKRPGCKPSRVRNVLWAKRPVGETTKLWANRPGAKCPVGETSSILLLYSTQLAASLSNVAQTLICVRISDRRSELIIVVLILDRLSACGCNIETVLSQKRPNAKQLIRLIRLFHPSSTRQTVPCLANKSDMLFYLTLQNERESKS